MSTRWDNPKPFASTPHVSRREFLQENAMGVGSIALAWMLQQDNALATSDIAEQEKSLDLLPRRAPEPPHATAMISLFQHGGPSHMDLTDPKPELTKHDGQDYDGNVTYSFANAASKRLLGSKWRFSQHGECGMELSELLPHTAGIVDDICLIRSMHTGANGHEVSIRYFHGGIPSVLGRPHMASWILYGLGSETQDLPAYMVLTDPGGHPVDGTHNWSCGFMPSLFQGTVLRPSEPRIFNLDPPAQLRGKLQEQWLAFQQKLNRRHADRFGKNSDLEARIANYELAARMQTSARDALDISQETAATQQMYGLDRDETREYGTRCLIARRLVERGVRFVQLFLAGQPWDNHRNLQSALPAICRRTDQPSAALVRDLKQRGMLDTTLVHWGGEIGRLPVCQVQGDQSKVGRDHNGQGFSCWLAGGGVQNGRIYGETDEFGHRAVVDSVTPNDYQATVLHLFGLNHEKLVYSYNGRDENLTNHREARVVKEILS